MPHHGLLASQVSRLESLKSRHAALSHRIEQEQQHFSLSDQDIKHLKKQRLYMKEQIEELRDEVEEQEAASA